MTEFENIEKEIITMEANLKNYIDDLRKNQMLMDNKYNPQYYKYTNNALYITLPYFLSTYKYQNKILYNFVILNKIFKYGIVLVDDYNSTCYWNTNDNNRHIEFEFYQYSIRNEYFDEDLFFEVLHEIKNTNALPEIYVSFYVINLLSGKEKIVENDLRYICIFLNHLRDLIDMSKKSKINNFLYAQNNSIDVNDIVNLNNDTRRNVYVPVFPDDYEEDGHNTRNMYVSADMPCEIISSTYSYNFCDIILAVEYKHMNICSIFNKISFIDLTNFILELKDNEHNFIKNLIISFITDVLLCGKCIVIGSQTYKNAIENCADEIKENENTGEDSSIINSYSYNFLDMYYYSNINYNYIITALSLTKKVLTECLDLITNYDISYSPDLVKLLI